MEVKRPKVHLFLMTQKGLDVIKQLPSYTNSIDFFVTVGTDKNVHNDFSSEICDVCINNKIDYEVSNKGTLVTADYSIAISWRWIIDVDHSLIVFHDSLLPKYRGFNPLVSALINGEQSVGVTALLATDKFDEGDMFAQKSIKLDYPVKINDVISRLSGQYALIFNELVLGILNNKLSFTPQDESKASYSVWRDEEDYTINWELDCESIQRTVDAMGYPYLGSKTVLNNSICRIHDCEVVNGIVVENNSPGKVMFIDKGKPVVLCGSGAVKITSAVYEESGLSIFPLEKYRSRFS